MFAWLCLLCLQLATLSTAEEVTALDDVIDECDEYELQDYHLESQGIYTGPRVPDKMLVFEVSEKSVLTAVTLLDSNETEFVRELMTVRDKCIAEEIETPNLTLLHKEEGSVCEKLIGHSQDIHDTSFSLNKTVMAVWTVTVPANQCFTLSFYFRHQRRQKDNYGDKITILDGELRPPVVTTARIFEYQRPQKNETTTVSLVYYFTSFSNRLYWRMAATLGCMC